MKRAPALATAAETKEILRLTDAAFAAAIADGSLRRVKTEDGSFIIGADIDHLARQSDPRHLAALARGEATEDDDPNSPRALAARVPRL